MANRRAETAPQTAPPRVTPLGLTTVAAMAIGLLWIVTATYGPKRPQGHAEYIRQSQGFPPSVDQRTEAERSFGPFRPLVGPELYGTRDPLVFRQRKWPQETMTDQFRLGSALFDLMTAIQMETTNLYTDIGAASVVVIQRGEEDRGLPPRRIVIKHPRWRELMTWWEEFGEITPSPPLWEIHERTRVRARFEVLWAKEQRTLNEDAEVREIVRNVAEKGIGFRFDTTTDSFDFTEPALDRSPLDSLEKLREIKSFLMKSQN